MNDKNSSFLRVKRKEYGRRGGRATVAKYGADHMAEIGRKGAATFHKRYRLQPVGLNDFAIVSRKDPRHVVGFLNGGRFGNG